jgi:hypothetical protein
MQDRSKSQSMCNLDERYLNEVKAWSSQHYQNISLPVNYNQEELLDEIAMILHFVIFFITFRENFQLAFAKLGFVSFA